MFRFEIDRGNSINQISMFDYSFVATSILLFSPMVSPEESPSAFLAAMNGKCERREQSSTNAQRRQISGKDEERDDGRRTPGGERLDIRRRILWRKMRTADKIGK